MSYEIKYISQPFESSIYQPLEGGSNFCKNNASYTICESMVLGTNETGNFHRTLYGRYLAGFAFEGYDLLPPLCILQTVYKDNYDRLIANNAVYFNGTIYDPVSGVFTISEYEKKDISVLTYVQIYIPEAYEGTKWRPFIPNEIQAEFEKDKELCILFNEMPPMQQSKILNYIYPFSKPSSFKECRVLAKPLTPAKVEFLPQYKILYSPSFLIF